jgi:hypothetical protein
VTWDPTLKRPQMITSSEWDLMSWMTSDYEVEIQAQSMEGEQSVRSYVKILVDI